jgi:DNA ligase (NAD+)
MKNPNQSQDITIYKSEDGEILFDVNVFEETVWLTQKQMAVLFERDQSVIARHINNIFKEKELDKNSVYAFFAYTALDGKIYNVDHYSLDMIISVGYRVKSKRGIEFRKWATGILKQYLLNGYAINQNRIKNIEEKIENLSSEIKEIHKSLIHIANRPITINNKISLISHKLENQLIELLDELAQKIKNDKKLKIKIEEIKQEIKSAPKSQKSKNKILRFFKNLGDEKSDLSQTIQGIGISKKILVDLVRLGEKFKDLFF